MHKNMYYKNLIIDIFAVTFRKEGVDWNKIFQIRSWDRKWSPSARKVWIEILVSRNSNPSETSPSARKVWIEISRSIWFSSAILSPSARKVWIEMILVQSLPTICMVTFRKEGVDWNDIATVITYDLYSHLPQGRCGLKSKGMDVCGRMWKSPSARKVWIEILSV